MINLKKYKFKTVFIFILTVAAPVVIYSTVKRGADKLIIQGIVINNDDKAKWPSFSIKFQKDLEISLGDFPQTIIINKDGDIYSFNYEGKSKSISIYDSSGKLKTYKIFNEGQGPGDFRIMDPILTNDDKLYIYDKSERKLTLLDSKDFKVKNISILNFISLENVQINNDNILYGVFLDDVPSKEEIENNLSPFILGSISLKGDLLSSLLRYTNHTFYYSDYLKNLYLYRKMCVHKITNNCLYYAVTDKYEINILNLENKSNKTITKKAKRNIVTEEDIKRSTESGNLPPGWEFKSESKYKTIIDDILVLEGKGFLVLTFDNDDGIHRDISADAFDENGLFLNKINVPHFYGAYFMPLLSKKFKAVHNDYYYTVEESEAKNSYSIIRYKMIWPSK